MAYDPNVLVTRLVGARRAPFSTLGPPADDERPPDLASAYGVAAKVADALGAVGGWKIGATAPRAQAFLGLKEPFWGAILAADILHAPAMMPSDGAPFEVEPEIVFQLAETIDREFDPAAVRASIGKVFIGLEVNRPSYADPFNAGALSIIADKGVNRALVLGPEAPDWREADLAGTRLVLTVGDARAAGAATTSGFEPFEALAWLAAARIKYGAPLTAGDFVATGSIGGSLAMARGATALLESPYGSLSFRLNA